MSCFIVVSVNTVSMSVLLMNSSYSCTEWMEKDRCDEQKEREQASKSWPIILGGRASFLTFLIPLPDSGFPVNTPRQ